MQKTSKEKGSKKTRMDFTRSKIKLIPSVLATGAFPTGTTMQCLCKFVF